MLAMFIALAVVEAAVKTAESSIFSQVIALIGGGLGVALLTFSGTVYTINRKHEESREAAMEAEIQRLRGLFWEHAKDLQTQITGLKLEKKADIEFIDRLLKHIYEGKGSPPPERERVHGIETNPIDLTKREAINPPEDLGGPDFLGHDLV